MLASGLNLVLPFTDGAQAQMVSNATSSGRVLADGNVADSIITNGTQPLTVMAENTSSTNQVVSIFLTFYELDNSSSLTLLESDTQLTPTTEMSDYGPN